LISHSFAAKIRQRQAKLYEYSLVSIEKASHYLLTLGSIYSLKAATETERHLLKNKNIA